MRDLLFSAKDLFFAAMIGIVCEFRLRGEKASVMNCGQELASIPMAQGGLTRLAIERLKRAGVPVAPLLTRAGLTAELVADPEGRLSVRSQVTLLDEAAVRWVASRASMRYSASMTRPWPSTNCTGHRLPHIAGSRAV